MEQNTPSADGQTPLQDVLRAFTGTTAEWTPRERELLGVIASMHLTHSARVKDLEDKLRQTHEDLDESGAYINQLELEVAEARATPPKLAGCTEEEVKKLIHIATGLARLGMAAAVPSEPAAPAAQAQASTAKVPPARRGSRSGDSLRKAG